RVQGVIEKIDLKKVFYIIGVSFVYSHGRQQLCQIIVCFGCIIVRVTDKEKEGRNLFVLELKLFNVCFFIM
ncbi:hypothetical protein ACNG34_001786, partial [Enterococcus faecium]